MRTCYRLPSGKTTNSIRRYCREWKQLSRPVAKALGCEVLGFDPGIHLIPKGGGYGFQISVTIAKRIKALLPCSRKKLIRPGDIIRLTTTRFGSPRMGKEFVITDARYSNGYRFSTSDFAWIEVYECEYVRRATDAQFLAACSRSESEEGDD